MGKESEDLIKHAWGGAKAFPIEGRFWNERERLAGGYTEADRKWRKQWLKDQELSHNEPRTVPELERALKNPFRRIYRAPLDAMHRFLVPRVGLFSASMAREMTGKFALAYVSAIAIWYYIKYNAADWERYGGWRILYSREAVYPGDPRFPQVSDRHKPDDYANYGFKNRTVKLSKD